MNLKWLKMEVVSKFLVSGEKLCLSGFFGFRRKSGLVTGFPKEFIQNPGF
jgi:hypothetical protein